MQRQRRSRTAACRMAGNGYKCCYICTPLSQREALAGGINQNRVQQLVCFPPDLVFREDPAGNEFKRDICLVGSASAIFHMELHP